MVVWVVLGLSVLGSIILAGTIVSAEDCLDYGAAFGLTCSTNDDSRPYVALGIAGALLSLAGWLPVITVVRAVRVWSERQEAH